MPTSCVAVGCSNHRKMEKKLRFFRFPNRPRDTVSSLERNGWMLVKGKMQMEHLGILLALLFAVNILFLESRINLILCTLTMFHLFSHSQIHLRERMKEKLKDMPTTWRGEKFLAAWGVIYQQQHCQWHCRSSSRTGRRNTKWLYFK